MLLLACAALWASPAHSSDRVDASTNEAAEFLLRQSMQVHRDGRHNLLLRALRHMQDPTLTPLFADLAESEHPALAIHGILGLAESSPERRLDLARLARIKEPTTQAELLGAAMDAGLVRDEDAARLMTWEGMDPGVRLVVATQLVRLGKLGDRSALVEGMKSPNLSRRALAALLALAGGDDRAERILLELNAWQATEREATQAMLLTTAARFDLSRAGPWAMSLASDPQSGGKLALLALQTAIDLRAPGADALWLSQYDSTADLAQRTRLALMALRLTGHIDPVVFQRTAAESDPLVRAMGRAGLAITAGGGGRPVDNGPGGGPEGGSAAVVEACIRLVQMHHPITTAWVLDFCREKAAPADARLILMSVVLAIDGEGRNREQRLADAMQAVQAMVERDAGGAGGMLRPMLIADQTSPDVRRAILLGLVATRSPGSVAAVEGVSMDRDAEAAALIALLKGKHGRDLSDREMADLRIAVRGGAGVPDTLRLQAGWTYLRMTGQASSALVRVLRTPSTSSEALSTR